LSESTPAIAVITPDRFGSPYLISHSKTKEDHNMGGITSENIFRQFDDTTKDLLETISSFTDEQFHTAASPGTWSPAQISEHLYKSESNVPKVLVGNSRPSERDPAKNIDLIGSIFLNFDKKLKSPSFIVPSDNPPGKAFFLENLKTTREKIRNLMTIVDLSLTFTDFPFPQLGEFTGEEWIYFVITHSRRHIRQMKNILQGLKQQTK
jgi:hypothetical protein